MNAYIYELDTKDVVCTVTGKDNKEIEQKYEDSMYPATEMYGLTFSENELNFATGCTRKI